MTRPVPVGAIRDAFQELLYSCSFKECSDNDCVVDKITVIQLGALLGYLLDDNLLLTPSWKIVNTQTGEWWSNDTGWGSLEGSDTFTQEEHEQVQLPLQGVWARWTEEQ